jgi:hypothetical protein
MIRRQKARPVTGRKAARGFGIGAVFAPVLATGLALSAHSAQADLTPAQRDSGWIEIFNGHDLTGLEFRVGLNAPGVNEKNTYSVVDGKLRVFPPEYIGMGVIGPPLEYSYFEVRMDYKFAPQDPPPGFPGYARGNNGFLLHGEGLDYAGGKDAYPRSIENQFLKGNPGRLILIGNMSATIYDTDGTTRAVGWNSQTVAKPHPVKDTAWVHYQAIVLGDSLVRSIFDGDTLFKYGKLKVGSNAAPLTKGYFYVQEEGQETWFRNWHLRLLKKDGTPVKVLPSVLSPALSKRKPKLAVPATLFLGEDRLFGADGKRLRAAALPAFP